MSVLDVLNEASQALDESIYQHNIVVRWNDGDLEGFSGTALSGAKKAKESAENKASRKAQMIKKEFTILDGKEFAKLDSATKKRMKRDWDLSQRMDESKEFGGDRDKRLQVKIDGKWQWVFSNTPRENHPVTTPKKEKAIKPDGMDYFKNKWANHEFRIGNNLEDSKEVKTENTDSIEGEVVKAKKEDHKLVNTIDSSIKRRVQEWEGLAKKSHHEDAKWYKGIWQKISDILDDEFISKPLKENEETPENIEADSEDFRKHEREIAKELVASLSVFLFAVEKIFGQEFDSAKEAEDFIFSAFKSLRTREVDVLRNMLRRFDRIGGERMADLFKRSLTRDLGR